MIAFVTCYNAVNVASVGSYWLAGTRILLNQYFSSYIVYKRYENQALHLLHYKRIFTVCSVTMQKFDCIFCSELVR